MCADFKVIHLLQLFV